MDDTDNSPVLISMNETCRITSYSRTTINRKRKDGTFPQAVHLGDKRVAFVRGEVVAYVRNLIAARNTTEARA